MIKTNAQTGLNFQGVARTTNNVILASQAITIKLSILQGSTTGTADYTETRRVTTNAQGLFTAVIGDTGAISTLGNFTNINWKLSPKFLKIEMDAAAGTNFITMGTTQFQYVAYAQFAKSVDAENILGIVPVTLGGTGVNSLTGLKTALTLNNVNNTTDLTKPISTLTQTALDLKLNAADTSKYTKQTYSDSALLAKQVIIGLKLNASDTSKYTKQTYSDSALLTKLSITGNAATATSASSAITAGTANTATKLAIARNINGIAFDGSGDITITSTADAGSLTGTILKSTVTGSSLTSVGTLTNLTVTNPIIGSITGNAATATTAGNISATINTTLTTLSSLTSVGTLTNLITGTIINSGKLTLGVAIPTSSSAVLETSSTTQGFLPPRMTANQRNAISSPARGLMVYCTDCGISGGEPEYYNGTAWKNMVGGNALYAIGEVTLGGIIAYILVSGDPGYDVNTPHGIIAATSDQSSGIRWYNGTYTTTGATGTAIGTGLSNTNTIISSQGVTSTSYAAGLAKAYTGGGYTDWYLPSKDELNKLYLNKTAIGGFAYGPYWSSTEIEVYFAWSQYFSVNFQYPYDKINTFDVRAIRAF